MAKKEGIITKLAINVPEQLKKYLLYVSFNKKIGDYVKPPENHTDRICNIHTLYPNRLNIKKIANKITKSVKVEIKSVL